MSLKTELSRIAADVDNVLNVMIPADDCPNSPANVSRFAILDAGKRLRSFLTVQVAGLFNAPYQAAVRAGSCVEMIHNFSLIHDDLPCIDNDELRRGRPSVWAKYGQRNAVLAGDFLLNRAYAILAHDARISPDPAIRMELVGVLAGMTQGMIQGEWMDCEAETATNQTRGDIELMQSLKTGCLFDASASFGAILGNANSEQRAALKKFTDAMGLCFQITDDILDAAGDQAKVGKTLRKDADAGKATFVSLLGLDGARAAAGRIASDAKDALGIFGHQADILQELIDYIITRES
ncbi:MAG: polyprenyl synthetase family protein [Rickettsiales bacterium]|jgi:farnesyl diphosphate synthase|nr:polyprenyl synthetase family protein [Rickettsiales bacterium]